MASRRRRGNVVLAPISRWLLWSPWRLVVGLAVALITAGGLSAAVRSTVGSPSAAAQTTPSLAARPLDAVVATADPIPTPVSPATPTTESPASPLPAITNPPPTRAVPAGAMDRDAAAAAALAWTTLWARPAVSAPVWRAALRAGTYDGYLRELATVDPSRVPASKVKRSVSMTTFAAGAAHVSVPVAAGSAHAVAVTLIYYPMTSAGRWLVNGVAER